ncbi:hypothetical protein [Butyrivibrio sp. AE2015]|uniref:hypothetical protein n=1 Tax=Butyrivibrio sp. AE2015 TaxID=1280663 RepID=UPI0003B327AD|nr:hypothetical protein [Butyrivibrio sp. AE2015]
MNYRDEQEIDLIDLCRQILKKWPIIIVAAVIGLVLGSVGGYLKSAQLVDAETLLPIEEEEDVAANLETLKENLSEREITETELAVDSYLAYKKVYNEKLKYGENSIRMQLNAESVPTLTASYIIGDYYEVTYPSIDEVNYINNIVSIYSKEMYDEPVIDTVAAVLGGNIAETYVRELYSVYSEGNSILSINVTARSKEECQAVMDVLTKQLEKVAPSVKKLYTHSLTYLNTYYSKNMNNGIISEQQAQADALTNLEKAMLSVSASLTANQKSLFTALVDDAVRNKEAETITVREFSVKFAALGLVGGAFIAVLWFCLRYVLSQTIKTKDDIAELFGVPVLGNMKESADGELGMITAGVGLGAQKAGFDKVFVFSSSDDAVVTGVVSKVVETVKQNYGALNIEGGSSVLTDPASLSKLADSKGIVLVEKLRTSKYEDIAKELEIAKNYGVTVLGCVVVE